jgi:hypothetical protein
MRKAFFLLLACLAAAALQPRAAEAQLACYHCAYDSQGGAFCHPISPTGGSKNCSSRNPTEVLPGHCEFSGGGCTSALNVTPDGRALAAVATPAQGDPADGTMRRECDGAILERKYEPPAARAMRESSRNLRV